MRQTDVAIGRSTNRESILAVEKRVEGYGAPGQRNPHLLAGPTGGGLARRNGIEGPTALLAESVAVGVRCLAARGDEWSVECL